MKKAIILARVSTKEQEETGLSIEKIQLPHMREYAKNSDLEVVAEYVFQETASGKLRKKFDEMIKAVKESGDIKAIISYRVDRLTRNFRDAVAMDDLRKDYDKELHFVSDRLVLTKDSYGNDIANWDFQVFIAKQHINNCERHAYDNLNNKLETGESYGRAPYGYINIDKDESKKHPELERVVVDSFRAGIVRKVFDLYITGADSYLSIAKKIHKEYPSESKSLKTVRRRVENIIKNPYYHGEREYNGKMYSHKYPPIIEKEIFEMASQKREGRFRTKDKKKKDNNDNSTYGGLIACHECGCAFSPDKNRHLKLGRNVESEYYYYCNNAKHFHKKKPKGTNDKQLTEQFAEIFKQVQIPEKDLENLLKALRSSHEGKKQFTIDETNNCRQEIDRYQRRIEKAYEDKLDGSITQEQYDKYRSNWTIEKEKYEAKLARISKADTEYYITASYLLELASRSYELFMGSEPEEKRQIITLALQNLTLKDGKLCYEWVKPFDSIFVSAKNHTWGGIWKDIRNGLLIYYLNNE